MTFSLQIFYHKKCYSSYLTQIGKKTIKRMRSVCNEKIFNAIIKHTHLFLKKLVDKFGNSVGIYIVGRKIFYCNDASPHKYAVATL